MGKIVLDLSSVLSPLDNELKDTVRILCPEPKKSQDNLLQVIEGFANKYGKSPYNSIDDILNASLIEAQYKASISSISFEDSLKALTS